MSNKKQTEEEKLLNSNTTYQAPSNMTLDEWYNSNSKTLESKRQKQLEDAYVNQQLMNKYLGNQLANNGLSNTGAAALHYANTNANFRNEAANINANYMDNQQSLANQYYGYKKDEQDKADALAREEAEKQDAALKEKQNTLLSIYQKKVDNSLNEYDYLDDATIENLYTQFDKEGLGETNSTYLDQYINMYRGSDEDIKKATQDKNYKSYAYQFNDGYSNYTNNYDEYMKSIENAYNSGGLSQDHYYDLKSYLDTAEKEQLSNYETNYQNYLDSVYAKIGDNNSITDEDYSTLASELGKVKNKIGDENYNNALQTLTSYKIMGDIVESLDSNQRLSVSDYENLKSSIKELKKLGKLTKSDYDSFMEILDEAKLSVEQERGLNYDKQQEMLNNNLYNSTGQNYENALAAYMRESDDSGLEKVVRSIGSNAKRRFKEIGNTLSDLWKKYIWN